MNNDELFKALVPVLDVGDGLLGAYLFGSRASAKHEKGSDADVGLLFEDPLGYRKLLRLQTDLEAVLGLSVDVVDLRAASAFLALDVIRGTRFLCRDALACDEFELLVLRRAADLARFERGRREALLGVGG